MTTNNVNTIQAAASVIAKGAAQKIADNLKFCKNIDQVDESDFEGKNGYSSGNKITVSIPARYIPQNTFDITSSDMSSVEEKVSMTLDIIKTVPLEFSSLELATDVGIKSVLNRFVLPAAGAIASYMEQEVLKRATQATANLVGNAGSTTFAVADILAAGTKLDQSLAPMDDGRYLLGNSSSMAAAVDARKGLFNNQASLGDQYTKGLIAKETDGFNWMKNELIYTHTNGADVTGVALTSQPASGATTIAVNGLTISTTGIVKKGSVFTIAGVFKVHPITRTSYSVLQQFVVTADADSDGAGATTLSISPAIYSSANVTLQNVNALPTSTAALTFVGSASTSYAQNIAFHSSAFRLATVPLEMPTQVEFAGQETVDGITVSIVRSFDVMKRRWITRLDLLGGFMAVRPEWATRITA